MRKISAEILEQLKIKRHIVPRLMAVSGRAYPTVMLWVRDNSEMLTMYACLEVLSEEFNCTIEELLTPAA
ncbi:MAG: hypothetical protein U0T32_12150 [Chitinophagales bacterium]